MRCCATFISSHPAGWIPESGQSNVPILDNVGALLERRLRSSRFVGPPAESLRAANMSPSKPRIRHLGLALAWDARNRFADEMTTTADRHQQFDIVAIALATRVLRSSESAGESVKNVLRVLRDGHALAKMLAKISQHRSSRWRGSRGKGHHESVTSMAQAMRQNGIPTAWRRSSGHLLA